MRTTAFLFSRPRNLPDHLFSFYYSLYPRGLAGPESGPGRMRRRSPALAERPRYARCAIRAITLSLSSARKASRAIKPCFSLLLPLLPLPLPPFLRSLFLLAPPSPALFFLLFFSFPRLIVIIIIIINIIPPPPPPPPSTLLLPLRNTILPAAASPTFPKPGQLTRTHSPVAARRRLPQD